MYMYKPDLALDILHWLMCNKTNQTKPNTIEIGKHTAK